MVADGTLKTRSDKGKPRPSRINHVGMKFGEWTVLESWHERDKIYRARVRCSCGTVKVRTLAVLRRGTSKSCGCKKFTGRESHTLLGAPVLCRQIAEHAGITTDHVRHLLSRDKLTPEEIVEKYNPDELRRLKLTKTKKRGRPLKTLDGREISHEEFLRGLVQHQAIKDAS